MRRRPANNTASRRSFKSRAGKTAKVNMINPRRGGIRL